MNQSSFYRKLIERHLSATASDDEVDLLLHLMDDEEFCRVLNEVMDEQLQQQLLESKRQKMGVAGNKRYRLIGIAASFLLLCSVAAYFFFFKQENQVLLVNTEKPIESVKPGENKAVLTLADGRKILLKEAASGKLAQESGISVYKSKEGVLVYQMEKATTGSDPNARHSITTPNGGQYQVILEDGSKIWLNAASSISFPAVFNDKERSIQISGEVYCEIRKDSKRPFKVFFANQEVEVLGTHFNISAYPEDGNTKTTLLEGSVRISNTRTRQSKLLVPGQQAQLTQNGEQFNISNVDTEAVIGWKDGYFIFKREPLENIMRKIARWHDVEIVYQTDVSQKTFGGKLSRFDHVDQLLEVISTTGSVKFKREGRRVMVMD